MLIQSNDEPATITANPTCAALLRADDIIVSFSDSSQLNVVHLQQAAAASRANNLCYKQAGGWKGLWTLPHRPKLCVATTDGYSTPPVPAHDPADPLTSHPAVPNLLPHTPVTTVCIYRLPPTSNRFSGGLVKSCQQNLRVQLAVG